MSQGRLRAGEIPSLLVAAPKGRRGCDLAVTSFVESRNKRGAEGISLWALFFFLRDGKVEQAGDRPAIERRYDFAFQRERNRRARADADDIQGDVVTWLSHRTTVESPKR